MSDDPIQALIDAIRTATLDRADVFTDDALLDATVPNWRFQLTGADAIRARYATWFNEPVTFLELRRIPIPDGEVLVYEHEWTENGVRHRGHHAHLLVISDDRIAADTVWCGGRWPEPLLDDMATDQAESR